MKKMNQFQLIFLSLFLGTGFGWVLSVMGGPNVPWIADYALPTMQFMGDLFLRLIRMIVMPLVFFSIIDGVISIGDVKKFGSIGIKTILYTLCSAAIAVTIGLVLALWIKPGVGVQFASEVASVQVKELPGFFQVIIDMIPINVVQTLYEGNMMQIIFFGFLCGVSILAMGEKARFAQDFFAVFSKVMFGIIDIIIKIIPFGVFGLMGVAMTKFGVQIFGPVLKFIAVDYLAAIIHTVIFYSLVLIFIAKVNPLTFWKYAAAPWMAAFSTCTSASALPLEMKVAPKMGIPKEISNFVIPFGTTANMNGTCIYFGIIVVFATQLYNIEITTGQLILLVLQATLLSVGCAATPQIGLLISITLLTSMGLPLEAISLVAGIYRIIDQIHTATNASGDLVATTVVAALEGELDREAFNRNAAFAFSGDAKEG